jgi:hypothetical protein
MVTNIDPGPNGANYDLMFSTRAALGFNAVWVQALVNDYIWNVSTGCTFDGICPFSSTIPASDCTADRSGTMPRCYDFHTDRNEAYFARLDQVIASAAANGIVVFLTPVDTAGWRGHLVANAAIDPASGHTYAYLYGQYLGNRYRDRDNIVWSYTNDHQHWCEPGTFNGFTLDQLVLEIVKGVKSADTVKPKLGTGQLAFFVSSTIDDPRWNGLADVNAVYTYGPTYARVQRDYANSWSIPNLMVEAHYEYACNDYNLICQWLNLPTTCGSKRTGASSPDRAARSTETPTITSPISSTTTSPGGTT